MKIWDAYGADSWPTLVLIDAEGKARRIYSGEGNLPQLKRDIQELIDEGKRKKTIKPGKMRFDLAKFRDGGDTPLFFPGKVFADGPGNRLFIADSTHHRVVVTDLAGKMLAIIGTGEPGWADGPYAKARFDDPQGLTLHRQTLYVADRKNHLIRAIDLQNQQVRTIAGTGTQSRDNRFRGGPALKTGMNSPWDVLYHDEKLYIAMAGHHQIWTLDLATNELQPFAGNGRENIADGRLLPTTPFGRPCSEFAQPSGLTTDGKTLYVADSETSSIRAVPLTGKGNVSTLVGTGPVRLRRCGRRRSAGPPATRPGGQLPPRQALRRRHLQQQDQDSRPANQRVQDLAGRAYCRWLVHWQCLQRTGGHEHCRGHDLRRRHQRAPHPRGGHPDPAACARCRYRGSSRRVIALSIDA
jgi:DNA-binding beta-propeller fold protein YncE